MKVFPKYVKVNKICDFKNEIPLSQLNHYHFMEADLKLLLAENGRLLSLLDNYDSNSNTSSVQIIPVLLRYGSFTPSRLQKWPFSEISSTIQQDPQYLSVLINAFFDLVQGPPLETKPEDRFTLNEKKAVSFLLASRDSSFIKINELFYPQIFSSPRVHLACLEYSVYNSSSYTLNEQCFHIPIPFPQIIQLAPQFQAKFPLLVEFISTPSISIAKTALHRLQDRKSTEKTDHLELQVVLECAARTLHSQLLYTEIITPIWGSENENLNKIVFQALALNSDLRAFCEGVLLEVTNTKVNDLDF